MQILQTVRKQWLYFVYLLLFRQSACGVINATGCIVDDFSVETIRFCNGHVQYHNDLKCSNDRAQNFNLDIINKCSAIHVSDMCPLCYQTVQLIKFGLLKLTSEIDNSLLFIYSISHDRSIFCLICVLLKSLKCLSAT